MPENIVPQKMSSYTPLTAAEKTYFFGEGEGSVVTVGEVDAQSGKVNRLVKLSDIGGDDTNGMLEAGSITIEYKGSDGYVGNVPNNSNASASISTSSVKFRCTLPDNVYACNFAIKLSVSSASTITVVKNVGGTDTTLYHSVAGGNTVEANKTYQLTCVGDCWTLAEFEV